MKRQKNGIWKLTDDEVNHFSILLLEESKRMEEKWPEIAEHRREAAYEIYTTLKAAGYFRI